MFHINQIIFLVLCLQIIHLQAVVQSNTPNYLFVKLADSAEIEEVDKLSSFTVRLRPLRQKKIYQFQAVTQGLGTNGLLRIAHSDYIKIVEEL